ncbi:MAG: hypothetical protein CSA20_07185 [Deltaproteobacteria bacterium]|nr:MAG: hypothetical protein CSA20_07185 [Deltaproteobacteria bacterium]
MERCFHCKARINEKTTKCARCGADHSYLRLVASRAELCCKRAILLLAVGKTKEAVHSVQEAVTLQATPFVLALDGFIRSVHLLQDHPSSGTQDWPPRDTTAASHVHPAYSGDLEADTDVKQVKPG